MIKDTNPDHYKVDGANFIEYMNDPKIAGFGNWMFANGFNSGVWASTNWISVNDRLPEQHDTIFAKLKGTDKWKKGLFEKQSEDVRVVIEYPNGYRRVHHSYLVDGVWACETLPPEGRKVLYWMENPELPKEETDGA